jgi:hypothetical protein
MTDEKTEVRIDVSPTLHPDAIAPLGKVIGPEAGSPSTVTAFKAAQGGLKVMYEGLSDMERANLSTRAQYGTGQVVDGSTIHAALPDDRAVQLAADMGDRFGKVAKAFDQSFQQVSETIDRLSTTVERALKSPGRDAMAASNASDIRRYVKDLKDEGRRMDFMHKAIEEGDVEVVGAVLGTNPYVSGLTPAHMEVVRDLASKKFCPVERAQFDAAKALGEHLTNASRIFVERYKRIVPQVRQNPHAMAMKNLKGAA